MSLLQLTIYIHICSFIFNSLKSPWGKTAPLTVSLVLHVATLDWDTTMLLWIYSTRDTTPKCAEVILKCLVERM